MRGAGSVDGILLRGVGVRDSCRRQARPHTSKVGLGALSNMENDQIRYRGEGILFKLTLQDSY